MSACEALVAVCERILGGFDSFYSAWEASHPSVDGEALYRELKEAVEATKEER